MPKYTSLKTYGLIDKETGEIIEGNVILIGKQLGTKIDKDFIKVTIAFLSDAVQDTELMGGAIRLFFYFIKNLDFNSGIGHIYPKFAMEYLHISEKTFYNYLNVLLKKGYIEKIATYMYRLLPYVAVKGSFKKQLESIRPK